MNRNSLIKIFLAIVVLLGLQTLVSCSSQSTAENEKSVRDQQLSALPEGFREVLTNESAPEQAAFFAKSEQERNGIIAEWERRKAMMDQFTDSEKELISILSQDDTEAFFAIAPEKKDQQEQFLADAEKRYDDMLNYCVVASHRRFGAAIEMPVDEETKKAFTQSEQAVIKSLTPSESKAFSATPEAGRERFLADTIDRKTTELLNCVSRPSRRSEEGEREM